MVTSASGSCPNSVAPDLSINLWQRGIGGGAGTVHPLCIMECLNEKHTVLESASPALRSRCVALGTILTLSVPPWPVSSGTEAGYCKLKTTGQFALMCDPRMEGGALDQECAPWAELLPLWPCRVTLGTAVKGGRGTCLPHRALGRMRSREGSGRGAAHGRD